MKISPNSSSLEEKRARTEDFAHVIVATVNEPVLVLDKELRITAASDNFYSVFQINPSQAINTVIFDLNNYQWDIPELRQLLEKILISMEAFRDAEISMNFNDGGSRKLLVNGSILQRDPDDHICIILSLRDNTHQYFEPKDHLKSFHTIFADAPAMICILRGPDHVFELVNEKYFQLIGNRDIIGKPAREAVPEAGRQGFLDLLDSVYNSGKAFVGNEVPIELEIGEEEIKHSFLNFVYQPTFNARGEVDGIFAHIVDVTEQVLARKKIEESENELRSLLNSVPAIIWMTDPDGKATFLSQNWYSYTGQSEEEVKDFGWTGIIHPEDREKSKEFFLEATKNKEPYSLTYRLKVNDGSYKWVMVNARPKWSNGNFDGLIGTVIEVHQEKEKEQVIREKEHRLRTIVEEANVATAVYIGEEMKIEVANDVMIDLWGKDRSVIGKTLGEALPELQGQPFHQLLREVYTTGETYWGKEDKADLLINGKMQSGYFNFSYKPLRDEKGEIYGILNMALDVTETVQSQVLLRESESHFRQMADLMPGKVANTDAEGNFMYFNQNWLDYTGLNSEELKELGWSKFIHPEEKGEYLRRWQKSLTSGNNFEMELRLMEDTGQYKWHLSRAEAVRDETGKVKMWIGTNTEIHKIKEEEKRKEDFLKMVSHELKTPVTSIKGYVQLLLSMLKKQSSLKSSPIPLKASLERIDHQIVRLTRLISEMLDLSRIEENKLELQKENFSINELVIQTVQDIHFTNTQHKIQIHHECNCNVFADKDRIGQVLINFITNSIKYSPESQEIDVYIFKAGRDKVAVSVRDKGIGIDKANHRKIFKRFYRIGMESEETYSGFGIGLYLAKEIIQRHNGQIKVQSELGKGSDFSFILDVAPED